MKAPLMRQQKDLDPADTAPVADLSLRIEAIDVALYGGKAPGRKARPVRVMAVEASPPATPDEILEGARYLVSENKTHLLTRAQREALQQAGPPKGA
jgi:hypothetical protein